MNKARRMEGIKGLLYRVHIEAWPPRGIALNVCIALLMLAVLACSLTSPNAAPPSNGVVGTLTRQLDLVEKGVDQASLQEVIDSEVLAAGELVRISNGGEALLDYGNQLQLRLFNDTRTNLVEATSALGAPLSVRLVLELGGMTGRLDNPGGSFQVRTPGGAQVLVLGTRFFVIYDPATRITWVGNFEGLLGVTAGGAVVQVPPGTYLMVPAGERPGPPLPLPFDQVQFEQRARQLSSASAALARLAIERRSTETQIAGITGITTVTTPVITPLITDTPPAPTQTPIQPTDTPAQEGPPSNGSPTRTNTSIPQPGDIKPPSITVLPPSQEAIGVGKTCPPGAGIVRLKAVAFDPGGVSAVTASWSLGALHGVEQLRDNAKGNYIGEIGPVDITGKMRVTVYAVDRAGNLSSAPTFEVDLYPCPDTRTPVIGMLETTPQVSMFQACSGTPNPLTLYTRVEDDGQVDRVVAILKVGGESSTIEMEALGDGRYRTTLFLESPAGDVSLHVEAFDTAGNQGFSSPIPILVENCPPQKPEILSVELSPEKIAPGEVCPGLPVVTLLTARVTSERPLERVTASWQLGKDSGEISLKPVNPEEYQVDLGHFEQLGTLEVEVRASDNSGLESEPRTATAEVTGCPDHDPPLIDIGSIEPQKLVVESECSDAQKVTVIAQVVDESPISQAIVTWQLGEESGEVVMEKGEQGGYRAEIGPFQKLGEVTLTLSARDAFKNVGTLDGGTVVVTACEAEPEG